MCLSFTKWLNTEGWYAQMLNSISRNELQNKFYKNTPFFLLLVIWPTGRYKSWYGISIFLCHLFKYCFFLHVIVFVKWQHRKTNGTFIQCLKYNNVLFIHIYPMCMEHKDEGNWTWKASFIITKT